MSEYVKIKRRLYDELIEERAKYRTLCLTLETMKKIYEENVVTEEGESNGNDEKRRPHKRFGFL